jgi:hypothetical protein
MRYVRMCLLLVMFRPKTRDEASLLYTVMNGLIGRNVCLITPLVCNVHCLEDTKSDLRGMSIASADELHHD